MEWLLDIVLIVLLAVTLFHALRLERALGVLRRDRAALEDLVAGFNASTRQAEQGIERLRAATDGAGRQIAQKIDAAGALKDDMVFLIERGERLADRLDALVRSGRQIAPETPRLSLSEYPRAEAIPGPLPDTGQPGGGQTSVGQAVRAGHSGEPRLRSQAERDLLRALRLPR